MNRRLYLPAVLALGAATNGYAGMAGPAPEDMTLHGKYTKPGFEFCTVEGVTKGGHSIKTNCISIGGRVHTDFTAFGDNYFPRYHNGTDYSGNGNNPRFHRDNYLRNGADVRQARIHIKGKLATVWNYKIQYDLASSQSLKDAWLSYTGVANMFFTVGQFKIATDVEYLTSSNNITFMERSMATQAFTPARRVGLQANFYNDWMTAAVAVFGSDYRPDINGDNLSASTGAFSGNVGDQPLGVSGRLFFAPWQDGGNVAGLGVGAWYQAAYDDGRYLNQGATPYNNNYRFRTNSGLNEYRGRNILDTGTIYGVDSVSVIDVDGVLIYGPFDVEAAWYWSKVKRNTGFQNLDFNGGYVQGSYFITGEHRRWDGKNSSFKSKTGNNTDSGAVQVALRWDTVDLNDRNGTCVAGAAAMDITGQNCWFGGKQDNFTVGLNYYPTEVVRFMFNYIYGQYRPWTGSAKQNFSMFGARAQVVV